MTESTCSQLLAAPSVSLVIHQRPDGDALGTAAALYHYFRETKDIEIVVNGPVSQTFESVTGPLPFSNKPTKKLIVLLDCAQMHRTGLEKEIIAAKRNGATLIALDHHKRYNLKRFVDISVHDPEASSTAEVLFDCFRYWRNPLTPQVAQCLLLGIFTDTGCFRHANTSSRTLRVAGKLIRLGADLGLLQTMFNLHRTINKTKLWGRALSEVKLGPYGLAISVITQKALSDADATESDVAGLANTLALLDEARASAVLTETKNGWRATLRTRHSDVDLRRLAKFFEGRGLQKATGFFATNQVVSGKINSA